MLDGVQLRQKERGKAKEKTKEEKEKKWMLGKSKMLIMIVTPQQICGKAMKRKKPKLEEEVEKKLMLLMEEANWEGVVLAERKKVT